MDKVRQQETKRRYLCSSTIFLKFVCPSICCLPVCFSVCLSVSLSACLFLCLPVCFSVCLSVSLSACLFLCLPVCVSVCLSVSLSACLFLCLPVCFSVCLSASLLQFVRLQLISETSAVVVMLPFALQVAIILFKSGTCTMTDTALLGNWDGDISQLCGSVGIAGATYCVH